MANTPDDLPHLFHEAMTQLGFQNSDPEVLADRVKRLNVGLPLEDEFATVCSWLGRCNLIHKLDQKPVPIASKKQYQVPDLLASFQTEQGPKTVLVEVKSKKQQKLSFKPEYVQRLKNYSELVGLPILIAWKFYGVWLLFDLSLMRLARTNLNISLNTAGQNNLMGVLGGDMAYKIGAGAGIHFLIRKEELLHQDLAEDGTRQEQWKFKIEDAFYTDYTGNRVTKISPEAASLFMIWDLEAKDDFTDTHLRQSFYSSGEGLLFGHQAFVRLLKWNSEEINWREQMSRPSILNSAGRFEDAIDAAFKDKIVSHSFRFVPHTMPDFLKP